MIACPKCHRTERQNRAGKTEAGSQRYRCMFCQIKYTPEPKPWAYPEEVRQKAIQMYVDGMNLRRIARHLGVHHRTVSLWVKARAAQLPDPPAPDEVKEAELDELFTFSGDKKNQIFVITIVDRAARCYLGFKVVWQRTQEVIQEMVDEAPKAKRC